jgi:hypothetical protein
MTDLSPAASTILEALNEVSWDWSSMEQSSPQTIAAAALRAAAGVITFPGPESLLAIAAELDGSVTPD